jgi:15-cis-phytoene synthase
MDRFTTNPHWRVNGRLETLDLLPHLVKSSLNTTHELLAVDPAETDQKILTAAVDRWNHFLEESEQAEPSPAIEQFLNRRKEIISTLVGSSRYRAVGDDTLKDDDNAGWVIHLEPDVRDQWIERIRWIRLIDRLAEQELLHPEEPAFSQFFADWLTLLETGQVPQESSHQSVLMAMHACWFSGELGLNDTLSLQAWQRYLAAIRRYHDANLEIETVEQYTQMLMDLAGSFFMVLPFLDAHHLKAACYFGVLDQFYNHLRDLREDAEQGICYLPTELLNWFGVERQEFLKQRAQHNPRYHTMMEFWLDHYLPQLRSQARLLLVADDLHPSWQTMREWSLYRYRRIEFVFRECQFDYTIAPECYWRRVQADLPLLLKQIQNDPTQDQTAAHVLMAQIYSRLRGWEKIAFSPRNKLV